MNKEQLIEIVEACLLSYEGLTIEEMKEHGINPFNISLGIQLKDYLKENLSSNNYHNKKLGGLK